MSHPPREPGSELRGASRLTVDAVIALTDLVEAVHADIARVPGGTAPKPQRTHGITGFVYRAVRGITGLVGHGLDRVLARLAPLLQPSNPWPGRAPLLSAVNGVLGDYLEASANPLAISMRFRRDGTPLELNAESLRAALPGATPKLLVLIHGLCMNDLQWRRKDHDHGAALERELGYTAVYLHYNTGRHISTNGHELAAQLESLAAVWPVPLQEIAIIGHSMGGLVARSACHYGELDDHAWRKQLRRLVCLGTPHHGAPLERSGNWIDILLDSSPYIAPFARLGKIRSAGITDLRFGTVLDEDWQGQDRFERADDSRHAMPLPSEVACYAIAATTGAERGTLADRLLGDGLVPQDSALGRHATRSRTLAFPIDHQWVGYKMNHLDLLSDPAVYARIAHWFKS
jgi:pimeloyl-ACP methyl ester carboxylesterase